MCLGKFQTQMCVLGLLLVGLVVLFGIAFAKMSFGVLMTGSSLEFMALGVTTAAFPEKLKAWRKSVFQIAASL